MEKNTIKNILNFLKEKEGKKLPKKWIDSLKKPELIKKLENHPDGIQYKHNGNLELINTPITKLPNDLYVGGSLGLNDCVKLTKLPNDLYVGGNLFLSDTNIEELPNNLYVGRNLNLNNSSIKKLPNDLYVKGILFLVGTSIEDIPNNLYVGINLFIYNTPLAEKYTDEEIYRLVDSTGGKINGNIVR